MSLVKAAEELLNAAEELEKQAAEATQFVCDKCSHTANLAVINAKRKEASEQAGKKVTIGSEITVNDKIACPACEGTMEYKPTEASEKFYINIAEEKEDDDEKKEEVEAAVDYDAVK